MCRMVEAGFCSLLSVEAYIALEMLLSGDWDMTASLTDTENRQTLFSESEMGPSVV